MKILAAIFLILVVLYLGIGVLAAFYEKSHTDDPFNWKIVVMWPWIFLGGAG